jgi:uncharacterized Rossmann fold enzyme
MNLSQWMTCYKKILKEFGYDKEGDEASAEFLNSLLNVQGSLTLQDVIIKEKAVVFGAGPSLKENIVQLKNKDLNKFTLIAADGATKALNEEGIIPDIIVTDLDGEIDYLLKANQQGTFMVVHAHGDNNDKIEEYTPQFDRVMGTTQSIPLDKVYNLGGFTDGDRGVFLAVELGAKYIILAGMDFGKITTRYSRPGLEYEVGEADSIKQKKLGYGKKLVEWVAENEDVIIFNISQGEKIEGVKNFNSSEVESFLSSF